MNDTADAPEQDTPKYDYFGEVRKAVEALGQIAGNKSVDNQIRINAAEVLLRHDAAVIPYG